MQRIGFKEWALVCDALGSGKQSVIIRKGGIAEGRDGFAFRHREFFLFPTFFHEQIERVRLSEPKLPEPLIDEVEIRYFARVEKTRLMTRWEEVRALAPLHILTENVVRERFEYDAEPGVHVAFVEVLRLDPVWRFPNAKGYGGCRSWVELPEPPADLQLRRAAAPG
ncbi:MAG: DUF1802 family protein [Verrucomicrobiota bacterium]|jgi:hypothetical protein|nr:DUF1802 family protein [Verrucomicrobiota bacterium]MDQ3546122.1 DUF1802 family protein [Verrucomicrobiota bacterium]